MISGHMIGLEKHPRVQPVGVIVNWWQCMSKCVLDVAVPESKEACGTNHMCWRKEDNIKGSIKKMRLMWQRNAHDDNRGLLLIDACIVFTGWWCPADKLHTSTVSCGGGSHTRIGGHPNYHKTVRSGATWTDPDHPVEMDTPLCHYQILGGRSTRMDRVLVKRPLHYSQRC